MALMDISLLIPLAVAAGLALYILPFVIAQIRKAEHRTGILWVNLLLGWTVLGWLAALIWAVTENRAPDAEEAILSGHPGFDPIKTPQTRRSERAQQPDRWVLE